jgi:hypothetical protein
MASQDSICYCVMFGSEAVCWSTTTTEPSGNWPVVNPQTAFILEAP